MSRTQSADVKNRGYGSNNGKSQQRLTAAFLELLQEKPLEAITITELCRLAKTSRDSFYIYYGSKRNILAAIARKKILTSPHWAASKSTESLANFASALTSIFYAEREFMLIVKRNRLTPLIKDIVTAIYDETPHILIDGHIKRQDHAAAYTSRLFIGGMVDMLQHWISLPDSAREAKEDVIAFLQNRIKTGFE